MSTFKKLVILSTIGVIAILPLVINSITSNKETRNLFNGSKKDKFKKMWLKVTEDL